MLLLYCYYYYIIIVINAIIIILLLLLNYCYWCAVLDPGIMGDELRTLYKPFGNMNYRDVGVVSEEDPYFVP